MLSVGYITSWVCMREMLTPKYYILPVKFFQFNICILMQNNMCVEVFFSIDM